MGRNCTAPLFFLFLFWLLKESGRYERSRQTSRSPPKGDARDSELKAVTTASHLLPPKPADEFAWLVCMVVPLDEFPRKSVTLWLRDWLRGFWSTGELRRSHLSPLPPPLPLIPFFKH